MLDYIDGRWVGMRDGLPAEEWAKRCREVPERIQKEPYSMTERTAESGMKKMKSTFSVIWYISANEDGSFSMRREASGFASREQASGFASKQVKAVKLDIEEVEPEDE